MADGQAAQTNISAEVEITGTIKSTGSVRLDGKLEGELVCGADAMVGKSANIKGNVSANSIVVEGAIQGNIVAKDKIDLKSSARVTGDIRSKRLAVEDGVMFVGKSEVNPSGATISATPGSIRAESAGESKPDDSRAGAFVRR